MYFSYYVMSLAESWPVRPQHKSNGLFLNTKRSPLLESNQPTDPYRMTMGYLLDSVTVDRGRETQQEPSVVRESGDSSS